MMRQQFFRGFRRIAFVIACSALFGTRAAAQIDGGQECELKRRSADASEIVSAAQRQFSREIEKNALLHDFIGQLRNYLGCLTRANADYATANNEVFGRPSATGARFFTQTEKARFDAFFDALDLSPERAEDNAIAAQIAFLTNTPDAARKFAARAIELDAANAKANFVFGVVNEDLRTIERAVLLDPLFAAAHRARAELIFRNAGKMKREEQRAQYEVALGSIEKMLALSPKFVDAQFWRDTEKGLREFLKFDTAAAEAAKLPAPDANATVKPLKIISKPTPGYTDAARQNNVSGTIALLVVFGADAKIKSVLPITYLGGGLIEKSIEAAKRIEFEPETRNGAPVATMRTVEYAFRIY